MRGIKEDTIGMITEIILYLYHWHNMVSGQDIEITKEEFKIKLNKPL